MIVYESQDLTTNIIPVYFVLCLNYSISNIMKQGTRSELCLLEINRLESPVHFNQQQDETYLVTCFISTIHLIASD